MAIDTPAAPATAKVTTTVETSPAPAPARPAPKPRVSATFKQTRETKGAQVFEEAAAPQGQHRKIRTLYLRKEAFEELGSPKSITVTVVAND